MTISAMWYEVDFYRLSKLLLPVGLRKMAIMSFIQALLRPIKDLNYLWRQGREKDLYKLRHNSQVCYLRAALNDQFDPGQRRIIIVNPQTYQRLYIYTEAEQKPHYLGTAYLYDKAVYNDTGVDFIVQIPNDLVFDKYALQYAIEFYKMVTMRYRIINENGLIID